MQYECEEKVMRIIMNGNEVEIEEGASLQDVIELFEISRNGLAVAVNSRVVPRDNWQDHRLKDQDTVMLIQAAQGG